MKLLLSVLVLGCGVASAVTMNSASRSSVRQANKQRSRTAVVDLNSFKGHEHTCPTKQSIRLAVLRSEVHAYCNPKNQPAVTQWDEMLNAPRTLCYPYTFVNYSKGSARKVCAVIGMTAADDHQLPRDVRRCAEKCNYVQRGKCPITKSTLSRQWDEYITYDGNSNSDDSHSASCSSDSSDDDAPWRLNKHSVHVCKAVTCHKCQRSELLTFEDGEPQPCSLFLTNGKGNNFVYHGFHIKNAGIYDPWTHRCDKDAICCFQSDIDATISKPHVLISSQPLEATSISRIKPFGLTSVFLTLSSPDYFHADLDVTVYCGHKVACKETVKLLTGCPVCYVPEDKVAFSNINKIEFKFDLCPEQLAKSYLDIDNMLVCM